MDVWVRNRGGPVKMEVGEILTALVTDQKKITFRYIQKRSGNGFGIILQR